MRAVFFIRYSTCMPFYVYILRCNDATLYTGYAKDVASRLLEHNGTQKGGARYTHSRRPVKLVYSEACDTKSDAMKREYAIKQLSRPQKLLLIRTAKRGKK